MGSLGWAGGKFHIAWSKAPVASARISAIAARTPSTTTTARATG